MRCTGSPRASRSAAADSIGHRPTAPLIRTNAREVNQDGNSRLVRILTGVVTVRQIRAEFQGNSVTGRRKLSDASQYSRFEPWHPKEGPGILAAGISDPFNVSCMEHSGGASLGSWSAKRRKSQEGVTPKIVVCRSLYRITMECALLRSTVLLTCPQDTLNQQHEKAPSWKLERLEQSHRRNIVLPRHQPIMYHKHAKSGQSRNPTVHRDGQKTSSSVPPVAIDALLDWTHRDGNRVTTAASLAIDLKLARVDCDSLPEICAVSYCSSLRTSKCIGLLVPKRYAQREKKTTKGYRFRMK